MQCSTTSYNHITQPVLSHHTDSTLSLHFNGHFLGEPRLAGVYRSKGWWKWWWQLDYRSYVVQSSSQIITTNKPTSNFFTGQMPFLSPNQQCQSTEGKISHSMWLAYPQFTWESSNFVFDHYHTDSTISYNDITQLVLSHHTDSAINTASAISVN